MGLLASILFATVGFADLPPGAIQLTSNGRTLTYNQPVQTWPAPRPYYRRPTPRHFNRFFVEPFPFPYVDPWTNQSLQNWR